MTHDPFLLVEVDRLPKPELASLAEHERRNGDVLDGQSDRLPDRHVPLFLAPPLARLERVVHDAADLDDGPLPGLQLTRFNAGLVQAVYEDHACPGEEVVGDLAHVGLVAPYQRQMRARPDPLGREERFGRRRTAQNQVGLPDSLLAVERGSARVGEGLRWVVRRQLGEEG